MGRPAGLLVADRRRVAPAGRPRDGSSAVRRPPFASSTPLTRRRAADGALPRPSRLAEPLAAGTAAAAKGAERLGLHTVGDLLEHLPRDRSEARTIAELGTDEVATVVVEVRSIRSRPVRRRGMKPLVEATVVDATGIMKATFFNQPWLERKYTPGHPADAPGQVPGPQRASACSSTPRRGSRPARAARSPPTRRPRGSRRRRSPRSSASTARRCTTSSSRCPPGCARRAAGRTGRRARRGALRRPAGRPRPAGLRGAAAAPARAAAPPGAAPRGGAGGGARRARDAVGALARGVAALHADRRPARGDGGDRRGPRDGAADAAAADGGGRLGQDGRGALRDAARGRARRAGGADGADGDAGRAALRDAAEADAGRAAAGRAAHRLDDRRRGARTCSASSRAASCGCSSGRTR